MSQFRSDHTTAALGVQYEIHGDAVSYTHSATSELAADVQTYTMRILSSQDFAGGSRAQQHALVAYLRDSGLTRDPRRMDELTLDGVTWAVVEAVKKRGAAEWRLTLQNQHLEG